MIMYSYVHIYLKNHVRNCITRILTHQNSFMFNFNKQAFRVGCATPMKSLVTFGPSPQKKHIRQPQNGLPRKMIYQWWIFHIGYS